MLQLFGKQICHGLDFTVTASMLFTVLNLKPIYPHLLSAICIRDARCGWKCRETAQIPRDPVGMETMLCDSRWGYKINAVMRTHFTVMLPLLCLQD